MLTFQGFLRWVAGKNERIRGTWRRLRPAGALGHALAGARVSGALVGLCLAAALLVSGSLPARADTGAAPGPCPYGLRCLQISNDYTGGMLMEHKDPVQGDILSTSPHATDESTWAVSVNADSSFTLSTRADFSRCLTADPGSYPYYTPLPSASRSDWKTDTAACNGSTRQSWFFQPVPGSDSRFYIRNVGTGECLARIKGTSWLEHTQCHPDDPSHPLEQWTLRATAGGDTGQYRQETEALAEAYASGRCTADPSTCRYEKVGETPAALVGTVCDSDIQYNDTDSTMTTSFHTAKTDAVSLNVKAGAALGFEVGLTSAWTAKLTGSLSAEAGQTWTSSEGTDAAAAVLVPPHSWGYYVLTKVATTVTGEFTFDANGPLPWTATNSAQILVTAPGQVSTTFDYRTSPNPPICGIDSVHNPGITLQPSLYQLNAIPNPSPTSTASVVVGDVISFSFTLQNTGDTSLDEISVSGTVQNATGGTVSCPKASLDPSDKMTCWSSRYTVTDTDARTGWINETATVTATALGTTVTNSSSLNVPTPGSTTPILRGRID